MVGDAEDCVDTRLPTAVQRREAAHEPERAGRQQEILHAGVNHSLVEHLPVLLLDGKEFLHMPALPEDMHKPTLVIFDVDGEEFTDTEPGP
jgi:hypothetical protein